MGASGLTQDHMNTMYRLLGDAQLYHDETQIRYFIVGQSGHGTIWGLHKQALLEMSAREDRLRSLKRDLRCAYASLAYALSRSRRWWAVWAKGTYDRIIAIEECDRHRQTIETHKRQLVDLQRELVILIGIANVCRAELPKVLDDATRDKLNREFWVAKFVKNSRITLMTLGRLEGGMIETLMHLPQDMYDTVVSELGDGLEPAVSAMDLQRTKLNVVTPDGIQVLAEPTTPRLRSCP